MPVKHKVMAGVAGAAITAAVDHLSWSQSPSFAGRDIKYAEANTGDELPKQQFWDVWKKTIVANRGSFGRRKRYFQTVDELASWLV
ncbi:hypothetical protein CJJ09_002019 [Candidozyma auris]|nr:hypothetical protein CJJ09_002019 [[Candida] auris]